MLKRLSLALLAGLATLLLVEGALSLGHGSSLRAHPAVERLLPARGSAGPGLPGLSAAPAAPPALLEPPTDAERHDAGAASKGMYQMHEDPRVRYVLKPQTEVAILSSLVHTNKLGMRVRPGPAPADDALRLVVLGDSVAFGYGVNDDETPAAQLEALLAASRGPDARPVAAFTAAIPSWNHRNALGFLTDHWDELRPDIVVYLPIDNDLSDAGALYESGKLRVDPDPFQPDPLLYVSRSLLSAMEGNLRARAGDGAPEPAHFGPCALELDLTPESSRRYDDNARSIAAMSRLTSERGARLLVVQSMYSLYTVYLDERLAQVAPEVPILHLDRFLPVEFTLVVDGHASARTCGVRANWIASDLLARGWVDRGAGLPLPPVPAEFAALLMEPYDAQQALAKAAAARERMRDGLLDEIDFVSGKGLRQTIGGLNVDITLRMHGLFALRANGPAVQLELSPLADRPDLYPLEVQVELGGVPAGRIVMDGAAPTVAELALPGSVERGAPFEVRLVPATWCVGGRRERSQVMSLRPLRIACRAP